MMMTHEVRGHTAFPSRGTPTSNFSEEPEGGGGDLAQLAPPHASDCVLDVHGFHC